MGARKSTTLKHSATLKSEATEALAGAEYVRDKLHTLFDVGPNPMSRLAYAVKIRVKSDERLIQKVIARRQVPGKEDYRPADATDIVGVRLIAIYSEDLLAICHRLFETISFAQSSSMQLFTGDKLDDCVQEIIVYTSKNASYVYGLLHKEFLTLNLGERKNGKPKLSSVQSPDEKPYSSVHIVLDAVSYAAKSPKIIPIEIQVRTIFEDTWAEIDHPLQYKGSSFATKLGLRKKKNKPEYERLLPQAQKDVRLLKDKLDVISHEADNIRDRFLTIEELFGIEEGSARVKIPFSITYVRYEVANLHGDNTPATIREALYSLNELIGQHYARMFPGLRNHLNSYIGNLSEIINRVDDVIHKYSTQFPEEMRKDPRARYFLFMEKALALLWRFRIANHYRDAKAISFQFDVGEAIKIYCDLDNSGEYQDDPMIVFRLANAVMIKGGHIDYVITLLETANQRLAASQQVRKGDAFRAWIPRQYAYGLWRKKQYFDNEFARTHSVRLSMVYKAELLEKALSSTQQAMEETEFFDESIRRLEVAKNWNNWISYMWELVDLVGPDVRNRYEKFAELRSGIESVTKIYEDGNASINGLDTLAKAFSLCGAIDRTAAYVDRLRAALAVDSSLSPDDKISIRHTVDNASRIAELTNMGDQNVPT